MDHDLPNSAAAPQTPPEDHQKQTGTQWTPEEIQRYYEFQQMLFMQMMEAQMNAQACHNAPVETLHAHPPSSRENVVSWSEWLTSAFSGLRKEFHKTTVGEFWRVTRPYTFTFLKILLIVFFIFQGDVDRGLQAFGGLFTFTMLFLIAIAVYYATKKLKLEIRPQTNSDAIQTNNSDTQNPDHTAPKPPSVLNVTLNLFTAFVLSLNPSWRIERSRR